MGRYITLKQDYRYVKLQAMKDGSKKLKFKRQKKNISYRLLNYEFRGFQQKFCRKTPADPLIQ